MIVEFTIIPLGKGESISDYVAEVIDIVDKSGISYKLTPMGTIVEGEWDEVMSLIKKCHHHIKEKSNRVDTRIVIDDRKGAKNRISGKVKSVESKLGKEVKK
ncbi:MAG: MTH1187 family thiamine-binding protein [Thermoplasmatota archaeon]